MDIRNRYFSGSYADDNCELFGYREIKPEDWTYFDKGEEVKSPLKRRQKIIAEKIMQKLGHRHFTTYNNSEPQIFPGDMWTMFNELGDNNVLDFFQGKSGKLNMFKPPREECGVKKLIK